MVPTDGSSDPERSDADEAGEVTPPSDWENIDEGRARARRLLDAATTHRTHDDRPDDDYLIDVPPHHG